MSTGHVFCRMSFNWNLSESFLMIRLGWWAFERKTTEGKCHFHHTVPRVHTINMTYHGWCYLNHLAEIVFVSFLYHSYFFLPPFPYCTFKHSPRLRSGALPSNSLRAEYLHKLFGILLHWRIVYSPPFIYLFNHLFITGWTHEYLLYTLGYNPIAFNFLLEVFQLWPLGVGNSFTWLLHPFDSCPSIIVTFYFF